MIVEAILDRLWLIGWLIAPLTLLVAALCYVLPLRAATRHRLWVATLLAFVVPAFLPQAPEDWFATNVTAAGTLVKSLPPPPGPTRSPSIERPQPQGEECVILPPIAAQPGSQAPAAFPVVLATNEQTACSACAYASNIGAGPLARSGSETLRRGTKAESPSCAVCAAQQPGLKRQLAGRVVETRDTYVVMSVDAAPAPAAAETCDPVEATPPTAAVVGDVPSAGSSVSWRSAVAFGSSWLFSVWLAWREFVHAFPLPPAPLLMGVSALLLLIHAISLLRVLRLIRASRPAARSVVEMTQEQAKRMGLAAPRALMVDARVSPMVICLGAPRLILPTGLWGQLDLDARRAVICHELAHLKRRDHWLCWLETLVIAMTWWNPVSWWCARRLREAAEASCDAWVTWLEPRSRRSYATALVQARQFVGRSSLAGTLGVTRGQMSRLKGRIQMIMTTGERPRASWMATLAVGAMVVAAWSLGAPRAIAQSGSEPRAREMRPEPTRLTRDRDNGGDDIEKLTREVEELSRRLAQVTRRLNDVAQRLDRPGAEPEVADTRWEDADDDDDAPVRGGWFGRGLWGNDHDDTPPALEPGSSVRVANSDREEQSPFVEAGVRSFARRYWLPEGKMDAITELMSRDDVPVLVRPGSGVIELIGSEEQHRAFEAFLEMIAPPTDPDWSGRMMRGAPRPARLERTPRPAAPPRPGSQPAPPPMSAAEPR